MTYTTKTTWLGNEYGCRVYFNDELIVEGRCATRDMIGEDDIMIHYWW